MDSELTIHLNLDRRKFDQNSQQAHGAERKRIADLISSTELAERVKSALIERENQRRVQAGVAAAEAERGIRSKALNYAQIVEAAKSKLIEEQNARRVAAMTQAMMTEDQRVARSLNERQVVEAAKSKIVLQENQRRIEAATRAMQSEEDRIGRVLTDTQVAERAKAALVERSNRQRVDAATRAGMSEEQLLAKVLTKEEAILAARNNLIQKANQKRVDAETKALEGSQAGWRSLGDTVSNFGQSLAGLAAGVATLGSLANAAKEVSGAIEQAVKHAEAQVDQLARTKDMVRELALIRGAAEGPSDAEVSKFMAVRTASGLSDQDAKDVTLEFEGAAAATKGINISDREYERFKPMIARYAAAAGGGPGAAGTYGKLSGILAGVGKYNKAEDLLAQTTQFNRILSAGVGENPVLVQQAAQVAGGFIAENGKGIVKDPNELAAITATASRISPTRSAEVLKSTTRVLRGFSEKWGPMLKEAGIDEHDTWTQSAGKLFGKMEQAEAGGRTVDTWLSEQGVDAHGAEGLMSMYRYRGMMGKLMQDESTPMTGTEAISQLDRKYATDVSLRTKVQQAKLDEAKIRSAMPLQYDKELDLQAQTRLQKRGEGEDAPGAAAGDWWTGTLATGGGLFLPSGVSSAQQGRRIRIEQEKRAILQEKGMSLPGRPEDTSLLGGYGMGYLSWINSGNATADYSAAGAEMELRDRTGTPRRPNAPATQPAGGERMRRARWSTSYAGSARRSRRGIRTGSSSNRRRCPSRPGRRS
ncbi:hypothetical protein [Singulisphaera sp. PoT]|uniref:hypothetical protein n=1 Tax=Singulisphaera sp. PoT TaxID=3411797 RepID=UPI003BF56D3C